VEHRSRRGHAGLDPLRVSPPRYERLVGAHYQLKLDVARVDQHVALEARSGERRHKQDQGSSLVIPAISEALAGEHVVRVPGAIVLPSKLLCGHFRRNCNPKTSEVAGKH
jgi:hypothetical protein